MSNKTFNIFCDESSHLENDKHPFMLLGYVCVPANQQKRHAERIKKIKEEHQFFYEIKWSKVSGAKADFYLDLIDYFFDSDLTYRAIVIKKDQVENKKYNQDFSTFYYKMYYQLIHHRLDMLSTYNVYLDIKDSLSAQKVNDLKRILQTQFGIIRNLQNIHSHESIFIQLADLITGAINYKLRSLNKMVAKNHIINKIEKNCQFPLTKSTPISEQKVNLFFIDLK